MAASIGKVVYTLLFEYETPKIVSIKTKVVGVINRLIQLLIIGYVIGYVLVWKKGYQEFSPINSAVTTKLKGVVYTNVTEFVHEVPDPSVYNRLWDMADYVIPPQENGAFFVLTNAIITPKQTQSKCPEAPLKGSICSKSKESDVCIKGTSLPNGNGVMTGACIQNDYNKTINTCEVQAWCPIENDKIPTKEPLLLGSENFTVLIKNSIDFSLWKNSKTRNILATSNKTYLSSCHYDSDNPSCPVFRLGTIANEAGEDYLPLATNGGVMAIIINWDCNLDYNIKNCVPTYSFRRLDDPDAKIANGWNFRYANYYNDGNSRTLYKAYGILFTIIVEGRGGKFNTIPLLMNVGSGLALLSIAVIVCDVIVLYCMKKRQYYKENKYDFVNSEEEVPNEATPVRSDSRSHKRYSTMNEESEPNYFTRID